MFRSGHLRLKPATVVALATALSSTSPSSVALGFQLFELTVACWRRRLPGSTVYLWPANISPALPPQDSYPEYAVDP